MAVALANRAVDAALMVAPFTEVAVEQKIGVPWIDPEPIRQAAADDQPRLYRQRRLDRAEAATWRGGCSWRWRAPAATIAKPITAGPTGPR